MIPFLATITHEETIAVSVTFIREEIRKSTDLLIIETYCEYISRDKSTLDIIMTLFIKKLTQVN